MNVTFHVLGSIATAACLSSWRREESIRWIPGLRDAWLPVVGFACRHNGFLLGVCFIGSLFPDLIDLGPAIANKYLGLSLPVFKVFPWHWQEHSGSIYDGSRATESLLCHLC